MSSDRIEKTIDLRAPRSRVWRALTDASQFGAWFGATMDGPFIVGKVATGQITSKGFEHKLAMTIERMEPEHTFSYRWHPYALDAQVDYSKETPTLVELRLEENAEGTKLTVVESGFDKVPLARRAEAFRMHSSGWEAQLNNVKKYVSE